MAKGIRKRSNREIALRDVLKAIEWRARPLAELADRDLPYLSYHEIKADIKKMIKEDLH